MLTYYSSIIPNSFRCLLFSKLCQHNWSRPTLGRTVRFHNLSSWCEDKFM